jgi:hypothetical protein
VSATEHTAHGGKPESAVELTTVVRDLADRIEALQADVRRLGGPGLPSAEPGWSDEEVRPTASPSYAWVSSIGAPVRRRPGVPRLLVEALFLAAVAAAAALAKLDAPVIAGLMAAAWILVALIEWSAARADRRRDAIPLLAPVAAPEPLPADPSWFVPPVEHTLLEPAGDSPTAITRLPAADPDTVVERPPPG